MIVVVVLWSGRMKLQIAFFVVSLLKQNVGSDAGFFEQAVIIHGRCGKDVYKRQVLRSTKIRYRSQWTEAR